MHCGAQNEQGSKHCGQCQAALPKMDYSAMMVTHQAVNGRYNQFREAAERVKRGEWSAQEMAEFLQNMARILEEKAQAAIDYINSCNYYEDNQEEVDLGLEGIQDYEAGMTEMYAFTEDGDLTHLDRGLEMIFQGNEKINEAMRRNREARKRLEEEWGWM
jgi:dGTP triphosphohydrolase